MASLREETDASLTKAARSAPVSPLHRGSVASSLMLKSLPKGGQVPCLVIALKISTRSEDEGKPMKRVLSSLPGRNTAGSMMSSRFVGPLHQCEKRLILFSKRLKVAKNQLQLVDTNAITKTNMNTLQGKVEQQKIEIEQLKQDTAKYEERLFSSEKQYENQLENLRTEICKF